MTKETNGLYEEPAANNNIELATDIVSAYVRNNSVTTADLPGLITAVSEAVSNAAHNGFQKLNEKLTPAVAIKKSITPEFIICLEDGKKFKSLKRHLRTHFNLTPDQYREKWELPYDYPMVAPSYAVTRSKLAKKMKLGHRN